MAQGRNKSTPTAEMLVAAEILGIEIPEEAHSAKVYALIHRELRRRGRELLTTGKIAIGVRIMHRKYGNCLVVNLNHRTQKVTLRDSADELHVTVAGWLFDCPIVPKRATE